MISEIFAGPLPHIVTGAFTTTFVSMLSLANLSGRVGWGAISDILGRKRTFTLAWGLGVPMYLVRVFSLFRLSSKPWSR